MSRFFFLVIGCLLAEQALAAALPAVSKSPSLNGCRIFPGNNVWNTPIDHLPVHPLSDRYIDTIGRSRGLHMDFGSGKWDGGPIGIPFNVVGGDASKVIFSFKYASESDRKPYPMPAKPKIEYSSDHHLLTLDKDRCLLYETWATERKADGSWKAGSGAIFDLSKNLLRPAGWTSADAAGLPILPGLVRFAEIKAGAIKHAIRFTAHATRGYVWPARHETSSPDDPSRPPFGMRFRLKSDFTIGGYPPEMRVILRAMQNYGLILADNGSDWYVSGVPDPRWDNDMLHLLDDVVGEDFEAVDSSGLMIDPDSAAARQP